MPRTNPIEKTICVDPATDGEETVLPEDLKLMSLAQLRGLWRQRMGRKDPPGIRSILMRELAWHQQQAALGGMDAKTRALIRSAIRQAKNTSPHPCHSHTPSKRTRPKPNLQPGTKLVRTWRGRRHEVLVLDKDTSGAGGGGRFEYNGESFRGLTAIAEKITGAHWSGPRFFGLNKAGASR